MTGNQPGSGTQPGVVIPFYVTGAVAFTVLCVLLLFSAESLTGHYFNPHLLSIVHTAALGWGTMIIFGAAYQLIPVISERELYSPPLALFTWYTLTAGTILLIYSFWDFTAGNLMIGGASLLVISILGYSINVVKTVRSHKRDAIVWLFLLSSSLWLLFTAVVGLLLAINLAHPFFERNHLEILKLHAHAGLAGWFLQLIVGVSARLVPMFLLGKSQKDRFLHVAFVLQNAGLILFLADGYFVQIVPIRVVFYALLLTAGVACWLYYIYDTLRNRMRKKIDDQMKHTLTSFGFLAGALLLLPLVVHQQDHRWVMLYGSLLFMGWITGILLGKTFKTLPFIVWNMHYKDLTGKQSVPVPGRLYHEPLIQWQYRIFLTALGILIGGIISQLTWLIKVAAGIWVVLSLVYLYNVLRVVLHNQKLWKH